MKSWSCCMSALAVLSLVSPCANAAGHDAEKQARRIFEKAETHFKAGLFAEALGEYQEGYDRLPLPGFLINIAQCQRRLGDLTQARATYRKFILIAPDSPYVAEVRSLIAELDRLLDGGEGGPPPVAGRVEAPSTAPPPPAPEEGAKASDAAPASATPATPNPLVTVPARGPEPPPSRTRWWLWGSVGGAVVVGAVRAAILLRSPDTTTVHDGSLGTLRR
jgi:tetratricopeptide (TPR) repeat protein